MRRSTWLWIAGSTSSTPLKCIPPTRSLRKLQGDTERVIGEWVAKSGRRDEVIIATKVSGEGYKNVRDGAPISPETINQALENSLRSLQTDYVDLYQLHWPNRGSYMFRQNWTYDPTRQDRANTIAHMEEVLDCFKRAYQGWQDPSYRFV